ncbi:DUF5330 domain-containing protein [Phyllobacterium sp. YR531]|uniref:DUF5330 domain-containing protein n=1 Tax=Phyllobacterium sp. YR531 TaxID=1144343 RepID=UPI00026F877B|nr:DUF5330 domain-containing protein [Phyllobacterium sp. YR531]EJN01381.1 hypothetical protein PMI41_03463 [Phyllobacterium sp. YR531]
MFFLIRFAIKFCFWMTVVSIFMPSLSDEKGGPSPIEALIAAQDTISDLSDFCTRKPQACETGKAAFANAGARAGEAAKVGYEYIDSQLSKKSDDPDSIIARAHADASDTGETEAIKAKLREMALREIINAVAREREETGRVDTKAHTGSVTKN